MLARPTAAVPGPNLPMTPNPTRAARSAAALVALAGASALLLQLVLSVQLALANGHGAGHGLVVYFGYFTILSNLLATAAAAAAVLAPSRRVGAWFSRPGAVTAIAAVMLLVAGAYHLLLRQVWDPQGLQKLADVALHYLVPALVLAWWWLGARSRQLRFGAIPAWTAFPLAYLAYALARGELTGLYPYPFIDVPALGYGAVAVNAAGLLLVFCLVAALLVLIGRTTAPNRTGR
jgi:hypothetical protein